MNISIFASIGCQNLWDELIVKNEIKLLKEEFKSEKKFEFTVFTFDKDDIFDISELEDENTKIIYKEYFPIWLKNPKNLIKNFKNLIMFFASIIKSDLVVIGWGWIIYDNELQSVWNPLKQWLFRTKISKLFWKKVYFFRLWLNIKNSKNLKIVKKIFENAYKIAVRDNYSFLLLKSLWFEKNLFLEKDPVFFDEDNPPIIPLIKGDNEKKQNWNLLKKLSSNNLNLGNLKEIDFSNKTIWFSLRKQEIKNYENHIYEILEFILRKNSKIIFIPHSFHKTDSKANDYIFMLDFYEKLWKVFWFQNLLICKTLEESYKIYLDKKININIAERLHSIILSYVYNIDFIWVSYSKKTDEILEQITKN